ncbi:hypothetical protein BDN70DRAFT_20175 [Pholiota conissans]|uniref:Uncharacterized protein n=1 Tax=Pholiota conissans TaxID=109636 RepID=A0A9P5ZFK1_9AGAR|nr:hypothetical protein BDN70DRAFT_20175 [Pholiota conissans]
MESYSTCNVFALDLPSSPPLTQAFPRLAIPDCCKRVKTALPLFSSTLVYPWRSASASSLVNRPPAVDMIFKILSEACNRWLTLTYNDPAFLIAFLRNNERDLQLQTLHLDNWDFRNNASLKLHTRALRRLSNSGFAITALNVNWQNLASLELKDAAPGECFEVLRRTPCLERCSFKKINPVHVDDFPLPLAQTSIVHRRLRTLELRISSPQMNALLRNLLCTSLKTLSVDLGHSTVWEA